MSTLDNYDKVELLDTLISAQTALFCAESNGQITPPVVIELLGMHINELKASLYEDSQHG